MRVMAGRAKCSCGRCATCQQFRFGGSEFDAGDGNPAREHRDSPTRNRYASAQHRHSPGQHRDAAGASESEYSRLQLNRRNYTKEHDSGNSSGQHPAVNSESEHSEQSGNNSERSAMRAVARTKWNPRCLESEFRIESELTQYRIFKSSHGQRRHRFGLASWWHDAFRHTVPSGVVAKQLSE